MRVPAAGLALAVVVVALAITKVRDGFATRRREVEKPCVCIVEKARRGVETAVYWFRTSAMPRRA